MSPNVESRKAPDAVPGRASPTRRLRITGAPCGTTLILASGQAPPLDEKLLGGLRHDRDRLRLVAQRRQDGELTGGWGRYHGVQRDDERLAECPRKRQDVVAGRPAENAVLVLEKDDVDVESAEKTCGPDVVAAHRLRDRRENISGLRTGRLVDDRDHLDRGNTWILEK